MSDQILLIFILVSPFVVALASIMTNHRTKLAKLQNEAEKLQAEAAGNRQNEARITAMENRIRVLERIITENRSSLTLAHEIDALRSQTDGTLAVAAGDAAAN